MASLSVYKGILNRTVPKAFYRLLWEAEGGSLESFLNAWGDFFAVLCMRGYSENLAGCITGTALFDEMEARQTIEAKVFKALDRMEAVIQHNEAECAVQ